MRPRAYVGQSGGRCARTVEVTYPGDDQILFADNRFNPALVGSNACLIIADDGGLVRSSESGVDGDGDGWMKARSASGA